MSFPARISTEWIASGRYSAERFGSAKRLHGMEMYGESNSVLLQLVSEPITIAGDTVDASRVLALYAWNLQNQMLYDELQDFLAQIPEPCFFDYGDLLAVRLRWLVQTGHFDSAVELANQYEQALSESIPREFADVLYAKCMAQYKLGRLSGCIMDLEGCYSLYRLTGNRVGAALAANYLGFVCARRSEYRDSLKWYGTSLPVFESLGLKRRESMVHLNLGITFYKVGDYTASLCHLRKSLQIGTEGNWIHRQCFANIALGNICRLTRDYETARKHLHTAYNQAQVLQFPREEALALEFLGDVYRDEGAYVEARRFYARAMAIGNEIAPEGDIVMEVHRRVGECLNQEGDQGEAFKSLTRALEMARAQGDRFEEAVIQRVTCQTMTSSGELSAARNAIDESIEILKEIEARHELAISLWTSANLRLVEAENPRSTGPRIATVNAAWNDATLALDQFIRVDVAWWTDQARKLVRRVSAARNAQERADRVALKSGRVPKPSAYAPGDVIVHQSQVMRDVLQLCDMFAATNEPVLITGETGTGKEVVARRLHNHSERAEGPLVVVNVAAIPDTMFEREFFGHVKGAFSGATSAGEGFAGRADGGTLFLDEIGDLPLELQPKLLRLLQEGTYQALGDPSERRTNIRLVAATNADLDQKVKDGSFRADLYYRLRILDLPLPPVRERSEDVLALMRHFLGMAAGHPVDLAEYFNRPSQALMESYNWPGNVREIAMIARQAHVALQALGRVDLKLRHGSGIELRLSGPGLLTEAAVVGAAQGAAAAEPSVDAAAAEPTARFSQSEVVERARILMALDENGGSRNLAAKALGIGRSTLYRRMEKYGIPTRRS